MQDKIAILIPCYNEEKNIAQVIKDFKINLPEAKIYVYDNNSSDNTMEIAKNSGAIVRSEYKRGKGNVLRTMFREINAECYLIVDGDNTYSAEHAREMCDLILNNKADMIIGDRLSINYFTQNKRRFHNLGNILVRNFVNYFFKGNVCDIMTGYRACSFLFIKTFSVLSKGFEIETEMTIHALDKNINILELPVKYYARSQDSFSKLNTFRDGYKVLLSIFRLYKNYRPLKFFSFIAFLFFIISCVLFMPVLNEYLYLGLVLKFPSLIVSGFFMMAAMMSLVCGLILDTVMQKARHDFEFKLNLTRLKFNFYKLNIFAQKNSSQK